MGLIAVGLAAIDGRILRRFGSGKRESAGIR
jgi:hypothetical protein